MPGTSSSSFALEALSHQASACLKIVGALPKEQGSQDPARVQQLGLHGEGKPSALERTHG